MSVRFAGCGLSLKYYNDIFDIHIGDLVYVSGKYVGKPGIVDDVTTKFKINLADYEKGSLVSLFSYRNEKKDNPKEPRITPQL